MKITVRFRYAVLLILILTAAGLAPGWGESLDYSNQSGQFRFSGYDYEPYAPDEFPEWAHVLRRYETIFFGSIPISFLFTSLGFDFYAYATHDFSEDYLPLFLGTSPEKEDFNRSVIGAKITVSISLSAVIAYIDYLIERRENETSP